jgi:hypothetical protein
VSLSLEFLTESCKVKVYKSAYITVSNFLLIGSNYIMKCYIDQLFVIQKVIVEIEGVNIITQFHNSNHLMASVSKK